MTKTFLALLLCCGAAFLQAQDPHRFDKEIDSLKQLPIPEAENLAVFTGSSSIRLWEGLTSDCKHLTIVNTGFGGSQTSDLLYFLDELVLRYKAPKVFIYEGDNDINAGKSPDSIMVSMKQLVSKIQAVEPDAQIYLISAKPSPSRWHLKACYEELNSLLKVYCESKPKLSYLDVWQVMLDEKGRPKPTIFVADSLHMNEKGYALWKQQICDDK